MRIIHFSDIHAAGWIEHFRGYFDKRLLGAFNYLIRRKHRHDWRFVDLAVDVVQEMSPDVVICTGDLASISGSSEFRKAVSAIQPLVENERFEFLYVPGNHDFYINSTECEKRLSETFFYLNRERWRLHDLPVAHLIPNCCFILVNQAIPNALYSSNGLIDDKTNLWLNTTLPSLQSCSDQVNILVSHFPLFDRRGRNLPRRRRCLNNSSFQEAFRKNHIQLALCGHIHDHFMRRETSGSIEICAGSLTYHGCLNVIDIDNGMHSANQQWLHVRDPNRLTTV